MIRSLTIENFYSFREKETVHFDTTKVQDASTQKFAKEYINLVNCVAGENASGKTSLLKALTFILDLINNSYDHQKLNYHAFGFSKEPTNLTLEFYEKEVLYKLKLTLQKNVIIHESLKFKNNNNRFQKIYTLDRKLNVKNIKKADTADIEVKISIDDKILNPNEADIERLIKLSNTLLLSAFIKLNYFDIKAFDNIFSNVSFSGMKQRNFLDNFVYSDHLASDETTCEFVKLFLQDIDLGIQNFKFKDGFLEERDSGNKDKIKMLHCVHKYKGGNFELPIFMESHGTRSVIFYLKDLLPILLNGGMAIIDEIEAGIHPRAAKKIIDLFSDPNINKGKAQLIFTTHQHRFLNQRYKSQIIFCEKSLETMSTEVYRLDEIEGVRSDDNFYHKYTSGAYGAIPEIDFAAESFVKESLGTRK
jgi:AAA15 family ATPase/GTPase